ncbi:MAG: galactose-1-phosphate uridylyltransferase [Desulfotomaculaceae bacterium]|nr:galactose-1-phosphate uridylyltransferase [Desulfotomaculaceae bacterium]MDD4767287.1 galactose-1-phosphate uridylyltransferase [Desulfotomaculaceae bacterium]
MPEWRKDPIVNRWVIIATERGKRPNDYKEINEGKISRKCFFCEGNEEQTPPEIIAYREPGTVKDTPGWWVRVVPNKFPALNIQGDSYQQDRGVYQYMDGVGAHEVIVESANHIIGMNEQTEKQVEEIIWIWRDRSLDLRKDTRLKYIQIFKNTGPVAGASLEHTHSQLIAIPFVPEDVRQEIEGMKEYVNQRGSCVICDMIRQEILEKERLIIDNAHFISFSPFASRFPFEIWITPREHQFDFAQISEEQVRDLAHVLRSSLGKLSSAIRNIPYNVVLHTAPVNMKEERHFHWHLEIMPRLTTIAGFELGTGYFINPTSPEIAAQALRETVEIYPIGEKYEMEVSQYV